MPPGFSPTASAASGTAREGIYSMLGIGSLDIFLRSIGMALVLKGKKVRLALVSHRS